MSTKQKNRVLIVLTAAFLCGFLLWHAIKPDEARSASERRLLASFPQWNKEAVLSGTFMDDFEKYLLDQFPMRDTFRRIKAVSAVYVFGQKANNDIYVKDGHAAKLEYPLHRDSIEYAASRFRFVYDSYLVGKDAHVYFSIIPDKNYFLASENGYPAMDYGEFARNAREQMNFAEYVDIMPLLDLSDYYRTDTHWRQEQIVDVAQCLAEAMGTSLSGKYESHELESPFYGVYCGQSALPLAPDRLSYLDNATLRNCEVYDYETDSTMPIYDLDKANGDDSYEIFLSGPKSLLTIENPDAGTDKELILFRDSFGSSIAPLLAEGYAKVTLVDIRYLSPNVLDRFVEFSDQDVLFLYSTTVLNNSITIK